MADQRDGGIAWCEETWNPIRGCSRMSPGCVNCYAERQAARLVGPGRPYEGLVRIGPNGPRWTGEVRMVPDRLGDPLRWTRPRMVFVNSMSDLFHERLSNEEIAAVFGVMAAASRHTFQILTKRSARMREWFDWVKESARGYWHQEHGFLWDVLGKVAPSVGTQEAWEAMYKAAHGAEPAKALGDVGAAFRWPLQNVWLGVSAEDDDHAMERVPDLLACDAAVYWVSYEPAIGPANFRPWLPDRGLRSRTTPSWSGGPALDLIVVGGEGNGARPFNVGWAHDVIDSTRDRACAFVKQLGENPYQVVDGRSVPVRVSGKGGNPAEWDPALRVRELPITPRPAAG